MTNKQPEDMKTKAVKELRNQAIESNKMDIKPPFKTNTRGWEPGFGKLKATYYLADKKEYVQEQLNLEESEEEVLKSFIKKVEDTTRKETLREVRDLVQKTIPKTVIKEVGLDILNNEAKFKYVKGMNFFREYVVNKITTLLNQVKK